MALYRECCFPNYAKLWWKTLFSQVLGRANHPNHPPGSLVSWPLAIFHKYNSKSLVAVLHINKNNAAGNSKRLYTPALKVHVPQFGNPCSKARSGLKFSWLAEQKHWWAKVRGHQWDCVCQCLYRNYTVLKVAAHIQAYLHKNMLEWDENFCGHSYAYHEKTV